MDLCAGHSAVGADCGDQVSGIDLAPSEDKLWRIVQAIIQIAKGSSNVVGVVTLRTGQTTTTVTKAVSPPATNVGADAQIFLTPRTANAAAILTSVYVSAVERGAFTIDHPSSANSDLTFGYEARG